MAEDFASLKRQEQQQQQRPPIMFFLLLKNLVQNSLFNSFYFHSDQRPATKQAAARPAAEITKIKITQFFFRSFCVFFCPFQGLQTITILYVDKN